MYVLQIKSKFTTMLRNRSLSSILENKDFFFVLIILIDKWTVYVMFDWQ